MFILGVKKSGTTDLFRRLNDHPQIVHHRKETQWFARGRWYMRIGDTKETVKSK